MSGITIPRRISTPLLSLLNYRRNYGVCIVKRGCPAQCRHARESHTPAEKSTLVINAFPRRRRATNPPFYRSYYPLRARAQVAHFTVIRNLRR